MAVERRTYDDGSTATVMTECPWCERPLPDGLGGNHLRSCEEKPLP